MKHSTFSSQPPRSSRSGFTLIEIMLVVAIIGFIAIVALSQLNVAGRRDEASRTSTKSLIGQYATAVNSYYLDVGKWPPNLEALLNDPGVNNWRGPYLLKLRDDLWGEPFQYSVANGRFEIISNAGGTEGGPISSNDI